jgi:lysine 6-dehydrogenase
MNSYAVLGASMMGSVAAKDLLSTEPDARVTLLDIDSGLLEEVAQRLSSPRLVPLELDVSDRERAAEALRGHDVAVGALPHAQSLQAIQAAIEARVSFVDLVGSKPELRRALDQKVRDAGVVVVPGLGVAPGLSNVLVARGMAALDETRGAVIYVGGIPMERTPPLEYQTVYSLVSMFGAYLRPAQIWVDGEETTAEPLTGIEILEFPPPIGPLEAFYTDGLASLVLTVPQRIRGSLSEKTLRYPGFAEKVKVLKDCGILEDEPVQVGGVRVAPRDVLVHQLGSTLELGPEGDILAMRVVVKGVAAGHDVSHTFELVDFMDPATRDTAMARTTCFPATIAARMIARGEVTDRGVRFPEELFVEGLGDHLFEELEERGVRVRHDVE